MSKTETKISGFQFGKIRICLTYVVYECPKDTNIILKTYRVTRNRKRLISTWNDTEAKSTYWKAINEILTQTILNI